MDNEQLHKQRHSLSHILAQAVLTIYPDAKLGIGPAIDNGFYYDIDFGGAEMNEERLVEIENKMCEIIKKDLDFKKSEMSRADAVNFLNEKHQDYKVDLINTQIKDNEIGFYSTGNEFVDMCEGPHVESTGDIKLDSFKLSHLAGAYWKGDEKNKMLTRIYGLAFATKEDLDKYVELQEEAKRRDHRIIGQKLKLFTISELVGAGLPLMQPKGMIIRKTIEDYLWDLHKKKGYSRVWTPHIAKEALYEKSGHAEKFGDDLFRVQGKDEKFIMKPMNCPHHMQIFADNQFSYKDMPVRYFEPTTVYRDEKSGQLGGLTRVRSITQDDGHLFCRMSQIKQEVATITDVIKEFYSKIGMITDYWVSLSVRGEDKSKYLGTEENWKLAEEALEEAAKANDLPYRRVEGEAAFYGPKLDFMFKDAIGREWQLSTIQCDFNLPERFDLSFINEKGEKERPVVIHRAISGSLERFMGILIEHYAGNFPLWLAPVQVMIVPIGEKHVPYAQELAQKMLDKDIRVEIDDSSERMQNKIRQASEQKIPYMLIVGDKEIEKNVVAVRMQNGNDLGLMYQDEIVERLEKEIVEKR